MTARLTMICSGSTSATRTPGFPLDEPLEERAKSAAAALARNLAGHLAGDGRSRVSPALRAAETALALGLDGATDAALADWNLGFWAGRTIADLGAEDPEAMSAWLSDPSAAPHGGESLTQLLDRVARWLDERLAEGARVVAVTHPAIIRAAVVDVLAAPSRSFWRIDVEPLGMTHFSGDSARWTLRLRPPARARPSP